MATLQETLVEVRANGDRLDSLNVFVESLRQAIEDRVDLFPDQQAEVDAIFAEAKAQKAQIDSALNTGVEPPAPVPPAA